ncbi:hypothetical protein TRFO_14382 [Tritrichomonas foetus]|uniref:Uncharacterized protein n=1 Tax=Tritrichomonas foetus TaxID=1144522 RepID=A0A1J4KWD0_9EUKA|nr:hypothetical protein TRFO_14382 [Tritrichomonas foetus]|eukprot:OHT15192.1 hypothetical protein TRFO_14382 [Tritrichomonas foetus]
MKKKYVLNCFFIFRKAQKRKRKSKMFQIRLLQGSNLWETVDINECTTVFDLSCEFSIDFRLFDFYWNEKLLDPFLPLVLQGIKHSDDIPPYITVFPKPEFHANSIHLKIESIIVEALKIEDRKLDNLNLSSEANQIYNSIAEEIENSQTPIDDMEYTEIEPAKAKEMTKDPLPPMWKNDENDDIEYQEQIQKELAQFEFHSIEDASKYLTRILSNEWKF